MDANKGVDVKNVGKMKESDLMGLPKIKGVERNTKEISLETSVRIMAS